MAIPEIWLKSAIESASGSDAFPQIAPEGAPLPYVVYGRESTTIDPALYGGQPVPRKPLGQFRLEVYAATYTQAKAVADDVRQAIHDFNGTAGGVTILHSYLIDEKDGDPVFFDGQDRPTFVVEQTYTVRWQE